MDEIISYCGKIENILAHNIMIFLSSVEIIALSRLWSIIHISVVVTMRWLVECKHKMKDDGWGYISMVKLLENLKDDLNMIIDQL